MEEKLGVNPKLSKKIKGLLADQKKLNGAARYALRPNLQNCAQTRRSNKSLRVSNQGSKTKLKSAAAATTAPAAAL